MTTGPQRIDTAIIGGGASGLAAAFSCRQAGATAALVEKDVSLGLKILATGNGRCNLSNERLSPEHYRNAEFVSAVFGGEPEDSIERFMDELGLLRTSEDGRLYPASRRAESVRDVLLDALEGDNVQVSCATTIDKISYDEHEGCWRISGSRWRGGRPVEAADKSELRRARKAMAAGARERWSLRAPTLVVATGGADESVRGQLGVRTIEPEPVLCPIACELMGHGGAKPMPASLDGVRAEARLSLERGEKTVWEETGEVLFRGYGISGIAAFDLSRRCRKGDIIAVDLLGDRLAPSTRQIIGRRLAQGRADKTLLDGILPRPLAAHVLSTVPAVSAEALVPTMRRVRLRVVGTTEHAQAQVMRGGIAVEGIDARTCAIRRGSHAGHGLFAAGEAVDVDADCGGYNLAWAWISGLKAGRSAAMLARGANN